MDQIIDQLVKAMLKALIWIGMTLTLPVQCIYNHRYGERTLSLPGIFATGILIPFVGLPWIAPIRFDLPGLHSQWITSWGVQTSVARAILITIMLWHWIDIQARRARGESWHSQSLGIPWQWLGPDGKAQRLFVQPGLTLVLGAVCLSFNRPLAAYFYMTAIILFAGWLLFYYQQRARLLDVTDRQIEAETLRALISRQPIQHSKGDLIEHVITPIERNNAPDLADILASYARSSEPESTPNKQSITA